MIRPCLAMAPDLPYRLAFPRRLAHGAEAVLTRVAIRLGTIRGVWPDDARLGLPLIDWSIIPPDTEIRAQVSRQIGAVEGVLRILEIAIGRADQGLQIAVRLLVSDGDAPVEAALGDAGLIGDVWGGYAPGAWYLIRSRPILGGGL